MCVCDPRKRTPFCGKLGCKWPKKQPVSADEAKLNHEALLNDDPDGYMRQVLTHLYLGIPQNKVGRSTTRIATLSSELEAAIASIKRWHYRQSKQLTLAALRTQIKLIEATRTDQPQWPGCACMTCSGYCGCKIKGHHD